MRIRALLILAATLLGVIALSGAALAQTKTCSASVRRRCRRQRHQRGGRGPLGCHRSLPGPTGAQTAGRSVPLKVDPVRDRLLP